MTTKLGFIHGRPAPRSRFSWGRTLLVALAIIIADARPAHALDFDLRTGLMLGGAAAAATAFGISVGFMTSVAEKSREKHLLSEELLNSTPTTELVCAKPPANRASKCAQLLDTLNLIDQHSRVAASNFIVSGVLILGTIAVWRWVPSKPKDEKKAQVGLGPMASATHGGLVLSGSW